MVGKELPDPAPAAVEPLERDDERPDALRELPLEAARLARPGGIVPGHEVGV